jgi:hypothetical protein
MARQVTCINKDNGDHEDHYLAISHLTWHDETGYWKSPRLEMVSYLENGGSAYVNDGIRIAYLVVGKSSRGNKYVRTVPDGRENNNLLTLPEC